jgi:poly(hydroxyalkanoate) depolymerase family esterase
MLRLQLALASLLVSLSACAIEGEDVADDIVEESARSITALAPTLTEVTGFGSNPGALKMYRYVPAGLPAGSPLVVALHGCTQTALVYATHTEWNTLADRYRFAVVYAEQQRANNSSSCFSWFQSADISRGQGEALSIKQMVDHIKGSHGVNPARVFVTGLSAGGFMTAVMMATYPDVFAGGGIHAGGAHACATSILEASPCQRGTVNRTPQQWGDLVRGAFSGYSGPYPRLIAFHGASDATVAPADMQQAVDQWSNVLGIDRTPEVSETFRTSTHRIYRDAAGRDLIETFLIANTGHALIVDPGTGTDQGGATGAFSEDHDIYSSYYVAKFWGLTGAGPSPGDPTPPQVSLTSPAAGATVSGTITVTMDASDNVGVARVELLVDGNVVGTDSAAPYAIALDTRTLANGGHTLGARAFDAAGNQGTAATRAVTVQNSGGGGGSKLETFSTSGGADQPGWSFGGWATTTAKDATGTAGSRSLTATAQAAFGTVTRTATWSGLVLGAAPRLSYQRQLTMSNANIMASTSFQVIVNDGSDHVVDAKTVSGFASYNETAWTSRANLDLSAYAGRTVTLKLVVTANDLAANITRATAWIDQIQLQ